MPIVIITIGFFFCCAVLEDGVSAMVLVVVVVEDQGVLVPQAPRVAGYSLPGVATSRYSLLPSPSSSIPFTPRHGCPALAHMDTGTSTRGRGARINGTSRGGHKNKQWIAPGHGASASQSREGSAHASDGERWERGGGPHRGRGRGRGSARPSSNLTLTVRQPEEVFSGTEDEEESQDVSDVEYMEGDETGQEIEEADPETPEERERFYQEVRGSHFCGQMRWNGAFCSVARQSPGCRTQEGVS